MALDCDLLFDEYYGDYNPPREIIYDHLAGTAKVVGAKTPKGDSGVKSPKRPEILSGYWGEILKDEVIEYKPIPEPPKPPEPPPTRYVGTRGRPAKQRTYEDL